ncbi:MAG: hypothetical protein COB66_04045 [Coxiella sp. (in: Bacteria)]|nr:MAG: hypothetical protein COB66_04045 [Coxiella sp. (in: g-proteobacteria)]
MIFVKWMLRIILTFVIISMLGICFLLTPYGFKFSFYVATKLVPGQLQYQSVSGMLLGPIYITGLDYQHDHKRIYIKTIYFNWSPTDLLHKQLSVDHLRVNGVTIITLKNKTQLTTEHSNTKETIEKFLADLHPMEPQPLELPFSLDINKARITNITYQDTQGDINAYLKTIDIDGTVHPNKINLVARTTLIKPFLLAAKLTAIGTLKHYKVDLSLKNETYHARFHARGDQNGATATIPDTKLFHGMVQGKIALHWYPMLAWKASLSAKNIDLNLLEPRLPKQINGTLTTDGKFIKKMPAFDLVTEITADKARIAANLHFHKQWNANWAINIPNLNKFDEEAGGSLSSKGMLTGQLTKPDTTGTLTGDQLTLHALDIGKLNSQWNLKFDTNAQSQFEITLNNLVYKQRKLDIIHFNCKGQLLNHKVQAQIDIGKHQIMSTINAHYQGTTWQGTILKFTSEHNAFGDWKLRKQTTFYYGSQQAYLKPLCLDANTGAFLCMQADWKQNNPWEFSVHSKDFSFTRLEKKAMIAMKFTSKLSINAYVTGIGKDIETANVRMAMSPGLVTYPMDNQIVNTAIRSSYINFIINKKVGLTADVNLQVAVKDSFKVTFSMPHFTDYSTPFDGKPFISHINFLLHDFRFVTLIENILKISLGKMTGHFTVSGTPNKPLINGEAKLHIPHFEYTLIHVKAHDLNAQIYAKNNTLTYDLLGYAHNKAPLTMKGSTTFNGPYALTKFTIAANDAEIIKNDKFDVFATATLHFILTHTGLSIKGNVFIPKANLQPVTFASTLSMPKSNVVYIGLPKSKQPKPGHKINLSLDIKLGKNVNLKAYGLRARLTGGLTLTMSPEQTTMANGQIRIANGTFQAYGQYLVIAEGSSISFIQSPASNPFIDARAFKYIDTTSETVGRQLSRDIMKVGVHIQGTIKSMKFSLYSQPATISQTDILSYLVLGYASGTSNAASLSVLMDAASAMVDSTGGLDRPPGLTDRIKSTLGIEELGVRNETVLDAIGNPVDHQSSFVVGDRLTKKIYIQYSRGMIMPGNIFKVQYRINPNWMLQTTTGTGGNVGTGGDVLYTIQTD